jgi:uncharacterized protein YjbI with pentapeptide repeats
MGDDPATCRYTHELDPGVWECPHSADGDGLCVFHRPVEETPEGAAAAALRTLANEEGKHCKEFVGARFDDLELAFARVDAPDNHPVTLLDAHVGGDLRLTSGEVTQPLVIDGITVEGETVCENTTFGAECAAADAEFRGGADFQGAEFRERVRLENATFGGPANFHAVEFDETADFEWVDFAAPADFARAEFAGDAVFTGSRFAATANFDAVQVGGKADFRASRFGGRSVFHDARFEESVAFGEPTDTDRSTVEVQYHDGQRPTESVFEFEGVLEHVTRRGATPTDDRVLPDDTPHFGGETEFVDVEFVEEVDFQAVVFGAPPVFRDAAFRDSVAFHAPRVDGNVVDLRDSEVPGGLLGQAEDGRVVYDLEGAVLGDVKVQAGQGTPFEHCRFVHTTFEGFDFGKFRDSVAAANWRIHTTLGELDRPTPSGGDLEATYLKAKNGANAVGDDKAASEFFRRELEHRRKGYRVRFREADSLRGRVLPAARWTANALLETSSGYGARPSRVILFSLAIVVAFSPLFWGLLQYEPYPSLPVTELGYVLVSFESFATGMRFGGPVLEDPTVRFVSELETFVGAFMIGLFVFTLTRSIDR